jgi:dihydroxyacetone kinase
MKKLINDPTTVVTDALAGIAAAHPELRIDHERKVIYRADSPVAGKVGLVSGGGSGHEPVRFSRPRRRIRCTKPPSSSTPAPGCCTS